jgi:diguanylate cyclase (GGDEF)-like protein
MLARTRDAGQLLDAVVEERFGRVGIGSTIAVARSMVGEGRATACEVGHDSWLIFGELAARRAIPLSEVTQRCLRWWDAVEAVLEEIAAERQIPSEVYAHACTMLRHSLGVTLVRMCDAFESERRRIDGERAGREEQLAFLATHDALTGLPNRALMLDRLEQMFVRSRRDQMAVVALFIDLDDFKSINDTLGHDAGDRLLRQVAGRFDAVVRSVDALGRLGGDEFIVVAGEMSPGETGELLAERLLDALRQPFELAEVETPVTMTASIGIATGERAYAAELLRDADVAMYQAKWAGKNGYFTCEPSDAQVEARSR